MTCCSCCHSSSFCPSMSAVVRVFILVTQILGQSGPWLQKPSRVYESLMNRQSSIFIFETGSDGTLGCWHLTLMLLSFLLTCLGPVSGVHIIVTARWHYGPVILASFSDFRRVEELLLPMSSAMLRHAGHRWAKSGWARRVLFRYF